MVPPKPESRVTKPAPEEVPVVEPTVETEQPILPSAPALARGCRKAQPGTGKPVRYRNYECYPCTAEQRTNDVGAKQVQIFKEITLNNLDKTEPAPCLLKRFLFIDQISANKKFEGGTTDSLEQNISLDAIGNLKEIFKEE